MSDAEANKALVWRFYDEVWAKGNVDTALEVFADDYARHDLRPTPAEPGRRASPRSRRISGPPFPTSASPSISCSPKATPWPRGGR